MERVPPLDIDVALIINYFAKSIRHQIYIPFNRTKIEKTEDSNNCRLSSI